MSLERNHVEMRATGRVGTPCAPQRKEIPPKPEARFAHGKTVSRSPASRQLVAPQKHMLRLPEGSRPQMIDIAEGKASQYDFRIEFNNYGNKGLVGIHPRAT